MNKGSEAFYGLGMIGAAVYFIQHSEAATDVIVGILKALIWPAFFVYKIFEFLKL